jgi:SAM-dependent methyltransferase
MIERGVRRAAFGQGYQRTALDRLGLWLSTRRIRSAVRDFGGLAVADVGSGYHASFTRSILTHVRRAVIVDVALAEDLKQHEKILAIVGSLPEALGGIPNGTLDLVVCNNVIEHLWEPLVTLQECRRIARSGGLVFVNVPSWRGKWFLELSAFRLGMSPAAEMNDHKMYYDPRDLWPLLVRAGFVPQQIRVGTHKFGLNTYALSRV